MRLRKEVQDVWQQVDFRLHQELARRVHWSQEMLSIDPWQLAIEVQHTVAEAMELNIWQLNDICKEWQDKKRQ